MSDLKKTVSGKEYPASDFAYVGDPQKPDTWHLLVADAAHVRDALSRFDQADMPDAAKKAGALKRVMAEAQKMGIDDSGFERAHGQHVDMSAMTDQWMEAFAAGDYGDKGKFTAADLQAIASSYDPKLHDAPVVIGHPELNAPAFGWVESLKAEGGMLFAKLRQVQPEFEDLVKRGMFKKRSVALYPKFGAVGTPYLRHIGFLGAMPPEVKGLADVQFAAQPEFREIEFNEKETEMDQKTLMDSLREFFGGEKPKLFTEAQLSERVTTAVKEATTPLTAKIATFEQAEAARITAAAAATERAKTFGERATAAVQKLKDARKWIPAYEKMGLPRIFSELAKAETVITFGEGDKKKEKPMLEVFAEFVGGIRQIVPEGELVTAAAAARKPGKIVKFNEPSGTHAEIDQDSVLMAEAAEALARDRKIPYAEALGQVRQDFAEGAGRASAGQV